MAIRREARATPMDDSPHIAHNGPALAYESPIGVTVLQCHFLRSQPMGYLGNSEYNFGGDGDGASSVATREADTSGPDHGVAGRMSGGSLNQLAEVPVSNSSIPGHQKCRRPRSSGIATESLGLPRECWMAERN